MKFFLDTEFIEGFHKPLFGKRRHFIDLISIGIVCEDGRTYYAISNEFNPRDANKWVKENVIAKLESKDAHRSSMIIPTMRMAAPIWKSNDNIKRDLLTFFGCYPDKQTILGSLQVVHSWIAPKDIEVYGYFADYDWVLFCSLFGKMIDLPKGFPMYCIDLKQTLDEKATSLTQLEFTTQLVSGTNWEVVSALPKDVIDINEWTFEQKLTYLKSRPEYPKQENEHNALSDAKWNYELYKFLQSQ